jgi:hypothetical protein
MKMPQKPPRYPELLRRLGNSGRFDAILELPPPTDEYPHWDRLRHLTPPAGFTLEEWWLATKVKRLGASKPLPLVDKVGRPFRFSLPDLVQAQLRRPVDRRAGTDHQSADP